MRPPLIIICLVPALIRASPEPYGLDARPAGIAYFHDRLPVEADATDGAPPRLSALGAFADLSSLQPEASWVPYQVTAPLWSDHAEKTRWLMVPGTGADESEQITFAASGPWRFPSGTVFMKHFDILTDERTGTRRRLETRFLVRDGTRAGVFGITYRWNAAHTDATLVPEGGESETLTIVQKDGTLRTQPWNFPSRDQCLRCHNPNSGGVLGLNAPQLHGTQHYPSTGRTDHQLRALAAAGYFTLATRPPEDEIPKLPMLAALYDFKRSRTDRCRSYLEANCAYCHQPGGMAVFDARYDTPFAMQNLVNAQILAGHPSLSRLHVRDSLPAPLGGMQPLAKELVDTAWLKELTAWIGGSFNPVQAWCDLTGGEVMVRCNHRIDPARLEAEDFSLEGHAVTSAALLSEPRVSGFPDAGRVAVLSVSPPLGVGEECVLSARGVFAAPVAGAPEEACWPEVALTFTALGLANDRFAAAALLPSHPTAVWGPVDVAGASAEPGEPAHAGLPAARSVWFKWRAPADARVALDTLGSSGDTTLAVYTGDALDNLSALAASRDAYGLAQSALTFAAHEGVEYMIAVDGAAGLRQLNLYPDNDLRTHAAPLDFGRTSAQLCFATAENGEPRHSGLPASNSIWFTWDAPESLEVLLTATSDDHDLLLAVYHEDARGVLTPVAANDDDPAGGTGCRVPFPAAAGQRCWIALDRKPGGRLLPAELILTAVRRPAIRSLQPPLAGGPAHLTVRSEPDAALSLEASDNLSAWTTIGHAGANAWGRADFIDLSAAQQPQRFYRVRQQSAR